MLVQIASEIRTGRYLNTRKIDNALSISRQLEKRRQCAATQSFYQGSPTAHQPRQSRTFQHNFRPRAAGAFARSPSKYSQFSFNGRRQAANAGSPMHLMNGGEQDNNASYMPFVYGDYEEDLPDADERSMVADLHATHNQINGNCSYVNLGLQQGAIGLVAELLAIYGDSVQKSNAERVVSFYSA